MKFVSKKIIFVLFFYFVFSSIVIAKPKITRVMDNSYVLNKLKKYEFLNEKCNYFLHRLVVIENIEYYGFDGKQYSDGEIVVLDVLADEVVKIFSELKDIKFPIENLKITAGRAIAPRWPFGWFGEKVIDDEDVKSLSGGYCCRVIQYTDRLSLHSYGTAMDINTLQNPCIFIDEETNEILKVVPKDGVMYLNRSFNRKGKEDKDLGKINNDIVKIFRKHGYDIWGGYWDFPIDYQHFQVSGRSFAELLIFAGIEDGKKIFDSHLQCLQKQNKSLTDIADEKDLDLMKMYKEDEGGFLKEISRWCRDSDETTIKGRLKNK